MKERSAATDDSIADPRSVADAWFTPARFGLLLAALIGVLFPDVLGGSRSFVFRDFGQFGYPLAHYYRESFWRGEVPLWNPLNNCGIPFLAQWNTMVFYPFSLIYLLLPLSWSLSFFCLMHLFLAGLGMYFLAWQWTHNRWAAAVAGLAFAFNGFTLNCLMWPNNIAALGLMPWVVLAVSAAWRTGGRSVPIAALVGAAQMLSGAPEVILSTWIVLFAVCTSEWWASAVRPMPVVRRFTLVVALIAGLSAVQLLPFLDLLHHSQRETGNLSYESAMPGWGWANFLVPLFHCYQSSAGVFFQAGQNWTSSYYLGIGLAALASMAIWLAPGARVRWLSAVGLICLILALGDNGYLYFWLRTAVPQIGVMNFPIKFVVPIVFVVPLLAALTLQRLALATPEVARTLWRGLAALGLVLLVLLGMVLWVSYRYPIEEGEWRATWQNGAARACFLGVTLTLLLGSIRLMAWKKHLLLRASLLLVLWLDVFTHAPRQNPVVARAVFEPDLQPTRQLNPVPRMGETRAMLSHVAIMKFLNTLLADPFNGYLGTRLGLSNDCNLLEDIPKVDGFYSLYLREERQVRARLYFSTNTILEPLADYLGVSQITAEGKFFDWRPRPSALPLVTAGQMPIFADEPATLAALLRPDFQPNRVIYLPLAARSSVTMTNPTCAEIVRQKFSAHRVELTVEAAAPSIISLAQAYYHPWKVWVDGRPTQLWRANHAFQAVQVPAGRHVVRLAYQDRAFYCGAIISALTLTGCLLGSVSHRKTARANPDLGAEATSGPALQNSNLS